MNIFRLINEKVIAVFMISMITVISVSSFLSNIDKEDLKNMLASVNFIKQEEKIEDVDNIIELGKETNLTIRQITYDEMTMAQKEEALYNGSMKLEYSAPYTTSSSRLTKSRGALYYNGHKETYYSQRVLPGYALNIPGRHVADDGTIRDGDGYISVAANTSYMSKGTILLTSLGPAKVYDSGCAYGTIDIYVNW